MEELGKKVSEDGIQSAWYVRAPVHSAEAVNDRDEGVKIVVTYANLVCGDFSIPEP